MSDCATGQREVGICEYGYNADAVDAIDMWDNLEPRQMYACIPKGGYIHTLCKVKSQFSSMKAWYRTVNKGTYQALTAGGDGYIGNSLMFNVLSSSVMPE